MTCGTSRKLIGMLSLFLLCSVGSLRAQDESGEAAEAHFETEIRPILVSKCIQCHGEKKQEGGLRLDTLEGILAGGESGAALEKGRPAASLLIEALKYESVEMPPSGQLSDKVIRQFETWVAGGAVWPESMELREQTGVISAEDRQWWAFQPLAETRPPTIEADQWSANEIDRFVLHKLKEQGMEPAPQADRATLARRLFFDLLGVSPSVGELESFLQNAADNAWEQLVDKLLDDPRYGEHWARYWLDLVRYSESDGWNQDAYRPHIWRYRDYVVNSLNSDKPYPDFVLEQLAGDEIMGDDPEHLIAAGFLRLGIYEYNQRDSRGLWNDILNETTDVAGDVFLGMSMACARCHDHKFDPIPQRDYFKLRAFFEPVTWRDDLVAATNQEKQAYAEQLAIWEEATAEIRSEIERLLEPYNRKKWLSTVDKFPLDIQACFHMPVEDRTAWQHQMAYLVSRQFMEEGGGPLKDMKKEDKATHEALLEELKAFEHLKPRPLPSLMTATDFGGVLSPTVIPGDRDREPIQPGYLAAMTTEDRADAALLAAEVVQANTSGRRTALAQWIGSAENPLTTRVIVNRVWQQHFGQGLVATPSDFGAQGQRPTHPALLDWLTRSFIAEGWSLKRLHKQIVMSATWRQSSEHLHAKEYAALDPAESLLWRARVRRLRAEQIRDAMLSASGELNPQVGGPSVEEHEPRRALYVKSFRNKNDTFLHGFDIANGLQSVAVRDNTTTPTQALLLFNGEYALQRAKHMAQRLMAEADRDPAEVVRDAFRLTWAREPDFAEMQDALNFVVAHLGEDSHLDAGKLADLCHILFNSNQFLYID